MEQAVERALAEARAFGFLGPGPLEAHQASAESFLAALALLVPAPQRLLDLGSGGGVPGLVLAASLPHTTWTLVDVHRRRTSFLARTVAAAPWSGRVTVARMPAEELAHDGAHRGAYDVVTSRSFGSPAITAECGVGFLCPEGHLLVAEPPVMDETRWPTPGLASLGLTLVHASGGIAVLRRSGELGAGFPRPWRALERRPAW